MRADDVRAIAALIVNGKPQADTTIVWRDGVVFVPSTVLQSAGMKPGVSGKREVEIDEVPYVAPALINDRVRVEWDENDVALKLTLPPELLPQQTFDMSATRPLGMIRPRPLTAFLNYAASLDGGRAGLTFETGINLRGKLLKSSVSRDHFGRWTRGPTALVMDDERRLVRWEVGDSVLSGGSLGGAAQILGATVSREFGIDPYFVRFTPLTLTGAATTASNAEVYVNGQLVAREQIAPGAFTLRNLLAPVGAGQAEIVLRDAFGREQRLTSSFYLPVTLLQPGLHQFRYGVGARRDDEAAFARDGREAYRGFAAAGDHRVGVKDWLTMGGRVEVTDTLVGVAPEVALRAPIGEIGVTLAGSHSREVRIETRAIDPLAIDAVATGTGTGAVGTGAAGAVSWSWRGRVASIGATARGATEDYRSMGISRIFPSIRHEVQAFASVALPRGISLILQHQGGLDWAGLRTERSALSASVPLAARANLNANIGRARFGGPFQLEAFVGIGFRLGARSSLDTAWSRNAGRERSSIAYQRSLPIGPGVGARLQWDPSKEDFDGVLQAQGSKGRVEVRHSTVGRSEASTGASVMGALVAIDGNVYATRPVDDAFGVIRVTDVPGVKTYLSHQYVGTTNGRGEVVVPNLVSYFGNRLTIDASSVPLDRNIGSDERIVAPGQRGGALVRFEALRLRPVIGRVIVILRSGLTIIPVYGDVELLVAGRRFVSPIGKNGQFYLDDLGPGWQRLVVRYEGVRYGCGFEVPDRLRQPGQPIDVGVVTCREDPLRAGSDGEMP